ARRVALAAEERCGDLKGELAAVRAEAAQCRAVIGERDAAVRQLEQHVAALSERVRLSELRLWQMARGLIGPGAGGGGSSRGGGGGGGARWGGGGGAGRCGGRGGGGGGGGSWGGWAGGGCGAWGGGGGGGGGGVGWSRGGQGRGG